MRTMVARPGSDDEDDRRALHEEIARLPEKYRAAVLLCDIEECTRQEAAGQLGWTPGTVASRLARGRALLRDRLVRRGFASAVAPTALLAACRAEAAVPEGLLAATIRTATSLGSGGAAPAAVALASAALRTSARLKVVSAALVASAGLSVAGAALLSTDGPADNPKAAMPAPPARRDAPAPAVAAAPAPEPSGTVPVSGRVVDPDGKPIPGARVDVIAVNRRRAGDVDVYRRFTRLGSGTSRADGTFGFDVPRTSSSRIEQLFVMAVAPGRALDGDVVAADAARLEATIEVGPPIPIRGRLIDLEGRPAAGIRLRAVDVAGLRFGSGLNRLDIPWDAWPRPITTDAAGRFTVPGMDRMSSVNLEVEDARYARQEFKFDQGDDGRAAEKTFVLAPARVLDARVVYDDGRPAPGVRLLARGSFKDHRWDDGSRGVTDRDGRARVVLGEGDSYRITARPADGEPYLARDLDLDWPTGSLRQEREIKLRRGVPVRGRLVEAGSGRPVAGARVEYLQVHRDNPLWIGYGAEAPSGPDGTFAVVVPRGPGDLLVGAADPDYLHVRTSYNTLGSGRQPSFEMYPDALAHLDLGPDAKGHDVALTLRRGVTVPCRVVGPDGQPVARALAFGRSYVPYSQYSFHFIGFNGNPPILPVVGGRLEVPGLDPEAPSTVYVLDPVRQLGATVALSGASAKDGPATIRLVPCGSLKTRFTDPGGKPVAGRGATDLSLVVTPGADFIDTNVSAGKALADLVYHSNLDRDRPDVIKSDADGNVTYVNLIPGASYKIGGHEFTAESGKATTLSVVVPRDAD